MDQWVTAISQAVAREDGAALAQIFGVFTPGERPIFRPLPPFISNRQTAQLARTAAYQLDGKWADACVEYAGCMEACGGGGGGGEVSYVAGYKGVGAAFLKLLSIMADETGWVLPLLHQSTYDMRVLANLADEHGGGGLGGGQAHLRDCSEKLQKGFGACINDRTDLADPSSKKRGVIFMVVSAFRVYFQLGNYRSCKHMINPVERSIRGEPSIVQSEAFVPKADLVTYRFYKGRLLVFEDKYAEAMEELEYALKHCHRDSKGNRRRILSYLIPVKLAHGIFPSARLLEDYHFTEFSEVCGAARSGDLGRYNRALQTHLDVLIRQGTYLVLEQAKALVLRNLLKHVYAADAPNRGATTQLKLVKVQRALRVLCDEEMDLDEVECVIANLIYAGHVKGYLSHKARTLVLSKNEPFPLASFRS